MNAGNEAKLAPARDGAVSFDLLRGGEYDRAVEALGVATTLSDRGGRAIWCSASYLSFMSATRPAT